MPAPPARIRSAKVPCGTHSSSILPATHSRSNGEGSLSWPRAAVHTTLRTRPAAISSWVSEKRCVAELTTNVSAFGARSHRARINTLGKPAPPKPEINTVAPSFTSATAALAELTRLSIGIELFPFPPAAAGSPSQRSARPRRSPKSPPRRSGLDLRVDQLDDAAHVKIAVPVRNVHGIG